MSTAWMDIEAPGPTALCATDPDAQEVHREASDTDERGHPLARLYASAKEWCLDCPVRPACLEYAMATEVGPTINRAGVLGGLTPSERAAAAGYARKDDPGLTRARNREQRRRRRQAQAAALTISCSACGQPDGARCISRQGNVTEPHLARVLAAEAAA